MAQTAPPEPNKELLLENRGLYQRIAALQRTERDLLAENQDLMRQYASLRQHHDVRRRQWRDDFKLREKTFKAQLQQLQDQLAQQEARMTQLARSQSKRIAPILAEDDICSWFDEKDIAWHAWAQDFASHDTARLLSLHPTQSAELCEDVKDFVKLTEDGRIPEDLLSGGHEVVPALLHAMLAHFISNETLASPFWIFNALAVGTLESPSIPNPKSLGPMGFKHMDSAIFNNVAPSRNTAVPTPGSPHFPPPLITSMFSQLGMNVSSLGMPMKSEMENLYRMLSKAQEDNTDVTTLEWRAQLLRLFAQGGMSAKDPQDTGRNEARRTQSECRLNYARKLKERFLGSAVRFLLKDQPPSGIEKLETRLFEQIDDALRFSCKLWSHPISLRIHGGREFSGTVFTSSAPMMDLCHMQASVQGAVPKDGSGTPPPGYFDGRPVMMVMQPAIEAVDYSRAQTSSSRTRLWLKSRVFVAWPEGSSVRMIPAPAAPEPTPRPDMVTPQTERQRTSAKSSPTIPRDAPQKPTADVLPASSYDPSPANLPKISLSSVAKSKTQ